MTSRYNLLPKATHFMPFAVDLNAGLHYSYTNAAMYCRHTVRISDESFDYVEMRTLAEDSLRQLHAMATMISLAQHRISVAWKVMNEHARRLRKVFGSCAWSPRNAPNSGKNSRASRPSRSNIRK